MDSKIEKINKIDVATRLTNQAISMFFHKEDVISIHIIVSAANEILTKLMEKRNIFSVLGCNSICINEKFRKEWIRGRKSKYNFFKHADKDANEEIEFNPKVNWIYILENIDFMELLNIPMSKEMTFFKLWLLVAKRDIFVENEKVDKFLNEYQCKGEDFFEVYDDAIKLESIDFSSFGKLIIPF